MVGEVPHRLPARREGPGGRFGTVRTIRHRAPQRVTQGPASRDVKRVWSAGGNRRRRRGDLPPQIKTERSRRTLHSRDAGFERGGESPKARGGTPPTNQDRAKPSNAPIRRRRIGAGDGTRTRLSPLQKRRSEYDECAPTRTKTHQSAPR